jgi:stearoyl-CoA desaturase (delta-9 desaturase)
MQIPALYLVGGTPAVAWAFFVSVTLGLHATLLVNSLGHISCSRNFETDDDSRNNAFVALLTLGEGWHNNHHFDQRNARHGLRSSEFDPTYWVILMMSRLGLASDLYEKSFEEQLHELHASSK